jgi:hypothetical protein
LWLSLAAVGLYLSHALAWLFFGLTALLWLSLRGRTPKRIAAAVLAILPSVGLAIVGFFLVRPLTITARASSVMETLRDAPSSFIINWPGDNRAMWVLLGSAAIWLALLLSSRTDRDDTAAAQGGWPYRLEIAAVAAILLSFFVGARFISLSGMLLWLLPHGAITGRRKLLFVPAFLLALYYPIGLTKHFRAFDKRAAAARRLIAWIPAGASTLVLDYGEGTDADTDPQFNPWAGVHSWVNIASGGYDPYAFAGGRLVRVRRDRALPAPPEKRPGDFTLSDHGSRYDFILTHREAGDYAIFSAAEIGAARLVGHELEWRLYRVTR